MSDRRLFAGGVFGFILIFVNEVMANNFIMTYWDQLPGGWWPLFAAIILTLLVLILGAAYMSQASFAAGTLMPSLFWLLVMVLVPISVDDRQPISEQAYNNTVYLWWVLGIGVFLLQIYEFALVGIVELTLKALIFGPGPKYRVVMTGERARKIAGWCDANGPLSPVLWMGYRLTDPRLNEVWPIDSDPAEQSFEFRNHEGKWVRCPDPRRSASGWVRISPTS
jgi:hypothetical protein